MNDLSHMPQFDQPGSARSTSEWQAADAAHYLHPFTDFKALAAKGSRVITRADNIYLWDSEGHKIFDAMSGLWCVNVGYGQQALVDAATAQMTTLPFYNSFFQTATPPAMTVFRLRRSLSTPSGSAAIEKTRMYADPSQPSWVSVSMRSRLIGSNNAKITLRSR